RRSLRQLQARRFELGRLGRQVTRLLTWLSVAGSYTLAIPQAQDDACRHAKIVLAPHGAGGVCIRGPEVISAEAHRERSDDGAFDPSSECVGWPFHPSIQVTGAIHGYCGVDQSRAD